MATRRPIEIGDGGDRDDLVVAGGDVVVGIVPFVARGDHEDRPGRGRGADRLVLWVARVTAVGVAVGRTRIVVDAPEAHVGNHGSTRVRGHPLGHPVDAADDRRGGAATFRVEHPDRPHAGARRDTHDTHAVVARTDDTRHVCAVAMTVTGVAVATPSAIRAARDVQLGPRPGGTADRADAGIDDGYVDVRVGFTR